MRPNVRYVVHRRLVSPIAFALVAVLALQQPVAADIYFLPPAPVRVALKPGEQAVSINTYVDEQHPPQRAYIRLAVTGHPVFVAPAPITSAGRLVKPGIEDATPQPLKANETVSFTDLDAVRSLLQAHGISANAITTRMAPAPGSAPMGEVLVAVSPVTGARFDAVAGKLSTVLAQYPAILGAGIIVAMDTCNVEKAARAKGLSQAIHKADILGHALGFARGALIRSGQHSTLGSGSYEFICGGQVPSGPLFDDGSPSSASLAAYQISLYGGAAFRISSRGLKSEQQMHLLDSARIAGDYSLSGVSHQFVIPDGEPFVSARGEFTGVVRADAAVATTAANSSHSAGVLVKRLRKAGVSASNIYLSGRVLYVKMQSPSAKNPFQGQIARENIGIVKFVKDCDSVRSAVAAGAFRDALARANTMAGAAHLRVGEPIAVSDGGTQDGALCGYGKSATVQELARAIQAGPTVFPPGTGAAFSSRIEVAWHLDGARAVPRTKAFPALPPPYTVVETYQPFVTHGTGALGSAQQTLEPTKALITVPPPQANSPALKRYVRSAWLEQGAGGYDLAAELRVSNPGEAKAAIASLRASGITVERLLFRSSACDAIRLRGLAEATRDALAHKGPGDVQAITDEGDTFQPGNAICGLRNNVSGSGFDLSGSYSTYDTDRQTLEQRVLVITPGR